MRYRLKLAFTGFLIGLVGLIFLPVGFKAFAFFFPAIFLCLCLSLKKQNFNLWLFIILIFPFVFIPSQMFTFDASNPFDIRQLTLGIHSWTGMITAFVFYGVPTLCIGGSIYATAIGQIDQASRTIIRTAIIMGILFIILYGFTMIGFDPTGGALTSIGNYYISLIVAAFEFPSTMYNLIRAAINAINDIIDGIEKALEFFADPTGVLGVNFHFVELPNLPPLPSYNIRRGLTMDASFNELNAMDYQTHIYAVHDILPIVMTCMCLITGLFMFRESWERKIIDRFDSLFGQEKEPVQKDYFGKVDLGMYIYITIILFLGWYLLLSYAGSFGYEPLMDWRMILYIFYTIIIIVCVLLLTTVKIFYYERATIKNTIKGTIGGVAVLKLVTMMFTPQVLDAYSNADLNKDLMYIGVTFIFIGPAESLFFHVFIPALVFGILLNQSNKKRKILYEEDRKVILASLNTQIETVSKMAEIAKLQKNTKLYNWLKASLDYLEKRKRRKELRQPTILIQRKAVLGRRNSLILFVAFGMVLPSYLFALIHYPMLQLATGIDYFTFWLCGLGTIYFISSIFIIIIHYSFGYMSSITAHCIFNTLTIWMVILVMGI